MRLRHTRRGEEGHKPHWLLLTQTDGQELPAAALPAWGRARALAALDTAEEPFSLVDGNVQGSICGT